MSRYVESLVDNILPRHLSDFFEASQSYYNSGMQIDISEAQFLRFMVKISAAHNVLEIGTFRGWSAAVLADALAENSRAVVDVNSVDLSGVQVTTGQVGWKLTTIELRKEQIQQSQELWNRLLAPGIREGICIIQGDAKSILKDEVQMASMIEGGLFDMVFIDADKAGYQAYIELSLPYIKRGGLIVLDNMLNTGLVATKATDNTTLSIRRLNTDIFNVDSVLGKYIEPCMIPAWDGVVILRKK